MVKWTEDQGNAIHSRNSNLLLAAAAGSGKTAVLVERIIQLIIKDKIDIDRLLIVTFTNAAAGEMRERIGTALLQEIEKKNENEAHLRRQTNLLNRASISTLHSFCIEIVRRYFHLIHIDPNFRIGDSTETAILKMEVLEEVFEDAYSQAKEEFFGLIERFGGSREDVPLQDLVLKLYEFIQSKPYPLKWLREKIEDFSMDMNSSKEHPWFKTIKEEIEVQLSGALESLEEAKKLCELPGGPSGYLEAIKADISWVEQLKGRKDLSTLYEELASLKHQRLGKNPGETDSVLVDGVKELRQQAKDIIKDIKTNTLLKSPEEYLEDLHELYPYMVYLYDLVSDYDRSYREKKLDRGIVDFNDLEHYALATLEHEEAAKAYQKKYEYIFVDEYQDSNIVQETILSFIKRENNLFMVGDVKQSIYRFRLADPSLFIEKYGIFEGSSDALNRRINLRQNFRSRDEIIHGVNYVFKNLMSKAFGEIDYDENAFLYRGGDFLDFHDPSIEMDIIEKLEDQRDLDEAVQELLDMEAEAIRTAQRIKELLENQLYDGKKKCYRNITYSDIVVLLRTTKNWAQTFLEILVREGVPVYADVNTGYFETIEIDIFMNLLRVIDNKRQDIPLLSIMRSPIGGFSTEELIEIRIESSARTFFDAILEYRTVGKEDLRGKLIKFMENLAEWKEMSRYMEMDEFIWKLYTDTGFYYYAGAMPGGHQRQGNLKVLVDRARQFQTTSVRGLFNFIKFIDKLKNSSGDMGTAKTLGENDDVVRIMSIHKSKGLEFPVVIVAGLGKNFNVMDVNAQVLFHKDLGIGPKYADPDIRRYSDTIGKIAMRNKIKLETLSEEMRILYVALTRAKEKLVLIGSAKNLIKRGEKWIKPLNPFHLSKGRSFLDWLCPIVLRHKENRDFREKLNIEFESSELIEDESSWKINIVNKWEIKKNEMELVKEKGSKKEELLNFYKIVSSEISTFINQRLSWEYPYLEATGIPSKLSVTDIKRLSRKELDTLSLTIPQLVKMPKFMEGKKQFTAMEKGIIIHFVMQHLQLDAVESEADINEQVEGMVAKELLKADEAEAVDTKKILLFFESPIGKRIKKADKVYREIPFNLTQTANKVISEIKSCEDGLLIQGIIDCYFKEGEDYILVDYKTDYISEYNKEQTAQKYRIQIDLYRQALELITGNRVKESYLYLFHLDEEVKL